MSWVTRSRCTGVSIITHAIPAHPRIHEREGKQEKRKQSLFVLAPLNLGLSDQCKSFQSKRPIWPAAFQAGTEQLDTRLEGRHNLKNSTGNTPARHPRQHNKFVTNTLRQ